MTLVLNDTELDIYNAYVKNQIEELPKGEFVFNVFFKDTSIPTPTRLGRYFCEEVKDRKFAGIIYKGRSNVASLYEKLI